MLICPLGLFYNLSLPQSTMLSLVFPPSSMAGSSLSPSRLPHPSSPSFPLSLLCQTLLFFWLSLFMLLAEVLFFSFPQDRFSQPCPVTPPLIHMGHDLVFLLVPVKEKKCCLIIVQNWLFLYSVSACFGEVQLIKKYSWRPQNTFA